MKLTVIGGGGVRSPLFVGSALRRAEKSGVTEICLHDINAEKLGLFGQLGIELGRRQASPVKITTTTDIDAALDGASHAVTTVRPGDEEGRIKDEKIALNLGVIGQETTGPGGFAMALRSIPVILDYTRKLREKNPDAWLFNFTNPAGLVAQALSDEGFERVVGICDSANAAQDAVATHLAIHHNHVHHHVYGLNHLSFAGHAFVNGEERLQALLADDEFLSSSMMRLFGKDLVKRHKLWMNEYLYYYYYAEQAVDAIQADARTRGEEVRDLNQAHMAELKSIGVSANPDRALDAYFAYEGRRSSTYMHYADDAAPSMEDADTQDAPPPAAGHNDQAGEGYAGVALNIIDALESGETCYSGLNVRNGTTIPSLRPDDVVEVSCKIDRSGIHPFPVANIPEAQDQLIQNVKRYERLTCEAIRKKDRTIAVEGLAAHPLVLSYSRSETLVNAYLDAHADYVGAWK